MSLVLLGSTSGSVTLQEPAVAGSTVIDLPATSGTMAVTSGSPSFTNITATGTIKGASTISVGNATPAASGAGITFPAAISASSDANTLDDYEEGTFTPTLTGGFSSGPTSYPVQTGAYTKIGRVVYFFLDLDSDGATANASAITIGGLPFTSITPASSGRGGAYVTYQINFDTNTVDSFVVDDNSTQIVVFAPDGNGRLGNAANININGRIVLAGFYLT
jgi:hypothetical protein